MLLAHTSTRTWDWIGLDWIGWDGRPRGLGLDAVGCHVLDEAGQCHRTTMVSGAQPFSSDDRKWRGCPPDGALVTDCCFCEGFGRELGRRPGSDQVLAVFGSLDEVRQEIKHGSSLERAELRLGFAKPT